MDCRDRLVGFIQIGGFEHQQVVIERDDDVGHGDNDQNQIAFLHGSHENEELACKTDGGGDAGQAEQGHHQRQGQQGGAPVQARQFTDLQVAAIIGHPGHDHETGVFHDQHGRPVEHGAGIPGRCHAQHAQQQVARMGDAGKSHQALEIPLGDGRQVAHGHRHHGHGHQPPGQHVTVALGQ